MKKIFTLFVMLLAAMAVSAQQLTVKGVIVSDSNMSDILGDGKVKFDKSTNTLTFTDADITYTEYIVGVSSTWKESLNIKFEGKNTFTTTGKNSCIYLACKQQEVKLWSDEYTMGAVTLKATDPENGRQGIENTGHNNITLLRLDLTIDAPKTDGIGPLNASATVEKLTIDKCNVAIKAGRNALRFKEVELIDSHYQEGYAVNGEKSGNCTYNGTVMKEVRVDEDIYGVWVDKKQVHAKIKHNILIDPAPGYTMYFEPKTNDLTLNNTKINAVSGSAILVNHENLSSDKSFKINLIGNSVITSSVADCAALEIAPLNVNSIVFTSNTAGSLNVTSPSAIATLYNTKDVTVKNCTVNLKNTHPTAPAFRVNSGCDASYSFISTNFSAESAGQDVFQNVAGLKYSGCFMNTPTDGFLAVDRKLASRGNTNKYVVVPGIDNIKPNFYYGNTLRVESLSETSVNILFNAAMDNLTNMNKMRYHVHVVKAEVEEEEVEEGEEEVEEGEEEEWVLDYYLNLVASSTELETEITDLEPGTKYILSLKAIDEAGNYSYYDDVEFTTLGIPTGINSDFSTSTNGKTFSVAGWQVDNNYRGIVIKNGKKYNRK